MCAINESDFRIPDNQGRMIQESFVEDSGLALLHTTAHRPSIAVAFENNHRVDTFLNQEYAHFSCEFLSGNQKLLLLQLFFLPFCLFFFCHRFSSMKQVHHSVFVMKQFTRNKLHHFTQTTTHNFLETKARGKERERTLPLIFGD